MGKTFERDIRFVIYAFVAGLLFLAALHVVNRVNPIPNPRAAEAEAFAATLTLLTGAEVADRLKAKPSMLVIYASWCAACRQQMPDIVGALTEGGLGVDPVFVSVDTNPLQLSYYLVRSDFHPTVTPYVLKSGESAALKAALARIGSHYDGSIPYVAFWARGGKIAEEISGFATKQALAGAAKKALAY